MKDSGLTLFELDQTKTQQLKKKHLKKAGIDATHVLFAEVDFFTENWYEALEKTGYDAKSGRSFCGEGSRSIWPKKT